MKGSIFLVDKHEMFCIHVLVTVSLSFLLDINVLHVLLEAVSEASHTVMQIFKFYRHDSSHMELNL